VLDAEDESPSHEVERVRVLIGEETARFMSGQRSAKLAPTIRALRARAERVRQHELGRASSRLAGLDQAQREVLEAVTRGLVNKLLHDPIVRGKALAAGANGEMYAGILRQLYALDEEDLDRDD
jgi:glutamyl-tRNA reductase